MTKSKFSASSATRKKHAAKKAADADDGGHTDAPGPAQRGQKKGPKKSRFEPKVKSYTPPPPPPKGAPDPVDLYVSAAAGVDPELIVVLRRLGKRDEATVFKGVEGLEKWINEAAREEGEQWEVEARRETIVSIMPVWAHHFPRLALHSSRRLRLAALSLHLTLTKPSFVIKGTREALLSPVWLENQAYVGAWCCSAFDADRVVRGVARRSWDSVVVLPPSSPGPETETEGDSIPLETHAGEIIAFIASLIFHQPSPSDDPSADPDPESTATDISTLRTQALLSLAYLISTPIVLEEATIEVLHSEDLWDLLDKEKEDSAAGRRAVYEVLGDVVERKEEILGDYLAFVSRAVLQNCWGERDGWAGVVAFLRRYPEAWTLAGIAPTAAAEESDDDAPAEAEAEAEEQPPSTSAETLETPSTAFIPTPVLSLFLSHLSLACSGLPSLYPTILLLLSTIPASILPPTSDALSLLFENFWAAWGSRALSLAGGGGATAEGEFVRAFLECVLWEVGAAIKSDEERKEKDLVGEWIGRVWKALVVEEEGERKVRRAERVAVIVEVRETLEKLAGKDQGLFDAAWAAVSETAKGVFATTSAGSLDPLALALKSFAASNVGVISSSTVALVVESVKLAVAGVVQDSERTKSAALLQFVEATRSLAAGDPDVFSALDDLSSNHLPALLHSPSSITALAFLIGHLRSPETTPASRASTWSSIFAPSHPPPPTVVIELIEADLPADLPCANLDDFVLELTQKVLGDDIPASPIDLAIVKSLLSTPEPFIGVSTTSEILALVSSRLVTLVRHTLALSEPTPALELLGPPVEILANFVLQAPEAPEHLPVEELFEVAHLLPNARLAVPLQCVAAAKASWGMLATVYSAELVMERLQEYLVDVDSQASPVELVNATAALLATAPRGGSVGTLDALLPIEITDLSSALGLSRPSPALSIIDPLVSQAESDEDAAVSQTPTDPFGLSTYARVILAILEISSRDFAWIKTNTWVLPHVLLLADVARDELALAGSTRGMFGAKVEAGMLERLVASAEGLTGYLLSMEANSLGDDWHAQAVARLRAKAPGREGEDLLSFVDQLSRAGREESGVYARRGFATCLQAILKYNDASLADAERWLAFAQGLSEGSPLACAILTAVKGVLAESPRFVRYQNELASTLAGVSSAAANSKGLSILRVLLATAPPLDAPIIFLPQQRSMFLIQKISSWVASDDEIGDELYSGVAELFVHLAPIVQELSGGHWDLIFDIIESNLESASWEENATLPAVFHSCRLLSVIKDLAASNTELRATAKSRIDKSLELVRDLFVERPASGARNVPRLVVLEIMATLVRDLPVKLLKMGSSFDQLVKLLRDTSLAVQQSSYDLVDRIAAKYVSDLVVEVELETEVEPVIELPAELVALLSEQLDVSSLVTTEDFAKASTFLLAWLTAFRFFQKGSPRIKAAYIDQLRRLDLVANSFLPSIFALLGLSERGRPFDVTPWQIDEFRIDLIDEITETTLPVFATYVYYRSLQAVPSLIRHWWEGCKNRQLSMAVSSFTSKHYSPVLIAHELAHLRDPNDPAGKALRDNEDFTVKVAAGANEVKAVFIIDEQSMEIGIRLPPDFPLAGVEVKDVRKVGVQDAQWRAWLLAVQQVITTQNGLIADALSLFKRNVTLHFDGVEPCAICYSIISVVDRSLPTKKCRTCNNRFHAGCLFKWFSTSHGSSCPLCRSLF